MKKKIFYELNEVPKRIFDFYAQAFPLSAFAKLRRRSQLFETITADVGELSPWITWPTLHRGVSNVDHQISDLGQDLLQVNRDFPNLHEMLSNNDIKVGVFGSLQSYPIPKNLDNYAFYVPDTFAAGSECYPDKLEAFQAFNLSMVKANGRNVNNGIAVRHATEFLASSIQLGLSFGTVGRLAHQLIAERFNRDRVVRRRSSQAEIAFDLYFFQLTKTMPDVSFFFTNHVASSMHRYWPTIFPKDYDTGKFDESWLKRWKHEIPHALVVANRQLDRLMNFCDKNDHELIVLSSMGQNAVESSVPVNTQALITNINRLLDFLGITRDEWEPRLAMAPQVVVKPKSDSFVRKLTAISDLTVNGSNIRYSLTSTGDIRFEIKLINVNELYTSFRGKKISPDIVGLELVHLQDASGANAYHIPEGILLRYDPKSDKLNQEMSDWCKVSVLDVAPSVLKGYNLAMPDYMSGETGLFN